MEFREGWARFPTSNRARSELVSSVRSTTECGSDPRHTHGRCFSENSAAAFTCPETKKIPIVPCKEIHRFLEIRRQTAVENIVLEFGSFIASLKVHKPIVRHRKITPINGTLVQQQRAHGNRLCECQSGANSPSSAQEDQESSRHGMRNGPLQPLSLHAHKSAGCIHHPFPHMLNRTEFQSADCN